MSTLLRPPGVHPVLASVADVRGQVADLSAMPRFGLSDQESLGFLTELDSLCRQVAALRLAAVREVDNRSAATTVGASDTRAWMRAALQTRPASAVREQRLAAAMDTRHVAIGQALAAAELNLDQAEVIVRALDALPRKLDPDTAQRAETFLLEQARELDAQALGRVGRHLRQVIDPDGEDRLAGEELASTTRRELSLSPDEHGMRLRGWLDDETAASLLTAIDSFAAPRSRDEEPDLRTPAQRRADALAQLVQGVLDGGLLPTQGGVRPHVTITVTLDTLQQRLGASAAELDRGVPMSAAAARRLACDAQVIPIVLGSDSQPLDVGRSTYTVPAALRRALIARDKGCAFPDCDRPPSWCHAHHVSHWADGGATALSNLVLLCGHHHRVVHHRGWTVAIGSDGHPVFTPPPWLGMAGQPPRTSWRRRLDALAKQSARGP
jgi:hypothetical protein